MNKLSISIALIFSSLSFNTLSETTSNEKTEKPEQAKDIYDNETKLPDDPTRIVTKIGFGLNHNFVNDDTSYQITGSIGLSDAQKINIRVQPETDEWSLGGSWLFDVGILNFHFSNAEYDNGANNASYNIGTFIPLSYFDFTPLGWQIFPMAGANFTEGELPLNPSEPKFDPLNPYVLHPTDSTGVYLGFFSLKPLSESFTAINFAGYSAGSDDYEGYWAGLGVGYKISNKDSINTLGIYSDNNFGEEQKIVFNYTHEF